MGRIEDYVKTTTLSSTDTFIVATSEDTKGITAEKLADALVSMMAWNDLSNGCFKRIDRNDLAENFRDILGVSATESFLYVVRSSNGYAHTTIPLTWCPALCFSVGNTHACINIDYSQPRIVVGGGNDNALNWQKTLAFKDDINEVNDCLADLMYETSMMKLGLEVE